MTNATLGLPELPTLDERSRFCLERYVELLRRELGDGLQEVWLFGSVARGEEWPPGMPIRSDVDLLVVTDTRLPDAEMERLVNDTYPLFLESGRQLGPQFRTRKQLAQPPDEATAAFLENARRDAVLLWRRE